MFAVRSDVPVRVDRAFDGLQRLATEHKHGWGVARFDGHRPWIETSAKSAEMCPRFEIIGEETATTGLLAHIRLASIGSVREANSHPFFAGGWALMHNGTLHRFDAVRDRFEREIDPRWRLDLKGDTDSERCLALFLTFLDGRSDVDLGVAARALARVLRVAEATCDQGCAEDERSSMNFIVSDGRRLLATRRGR
jgi:predicted glutamine amidotransferase